MKTYKFTIDIYVCAESEADAAESVIAEMDWLLSLDNQLQAFTHPGNGVEVDPETVE